MEKRNQVIDGIRGFVAIYVFIFHFLVTERYISKSIKYFFSFSDLAVQVFFVISGYLIVDSFKRQLDFSSEKVILKKFYLNRFFRIIPLWWLLLGIMFILNEISSDVLFYNMSFLFGFISFKGENLPVPPSWSLFVEEIFYLLFPFIFCLTPLSKAVRGFIFLFLTSLIWKEVAGNLGIPEANYFVYRFPFAHFQFFFLGFILNELVRNDSIFRFISLESKFFKIKWANIILVMIFICLYLKVFVYPELLAFLILLSVLTEASLLSKLFKNRVLGWIGVRCYFFYIMHNLFLSNSYFLKMKIVGLDLFNVSYEMKLIIHFLVLMVMMSMAAFLSYSFFELPMINLGKRIAAKINSQEYR